MAESSPRFEAAMTRLERAYGDVDEAYAEAAQAALAETDLQAAYEDATRLSTLVADRMRALTGTAADLRAARALAIYTAEELTLQGLAERIGVSRARAGQMTKMAQGNDPPAAAA